MLGPRLKFDGMTMPEFMALATKIPRFRCKPGCTDCCGKKWNVFILATRPVCTTDDFEFRIEKETRPDIYICAAGGHCAVYSGRSLFCRLFGTVAGWECPYGYGPSKLLTKKDALPIIQAIIRSEDYTKTADNTWLFNEKNEVILTER